MQQDAQEFMAFLLDGLHEVGMSKLFFFQKIFYSTDMFVHSAHMF